MGSEPHRTHDQGPLCQKTGSDSTQCASYKGCPQFKVRDNKSTKELRNFQDCQKHRRLPAYHKLGFSAVTVLVHPHSPNPMLQPHLIGPLVLPNLPKLGVHEVPDTQDIHSQSKLAALSRRKGKEVHKEGKLLEDISADVLFEK